MHHNGRVVSRTGSSSTSTSRISIANSNAIEVFIGRLRKKIPVDVIETVRGLGYRMTHGSDAA